MGGALHHDVVAAITSTTSQRSFPQFRSQSSPQHSLPSEATHDEVICIPPLLPMNTRNLLSLKNLGIRSALPPH